MRSIYTLLSGPYILSKLQIKDSDARAAWERASDEIDIKVYHPEKSDAGLREREELILALYYKSAFLIPLSGFIVLFWAMIFGNDSIYPPVLLLSAFGSWALFSSILRGAILWVDRFRWKKHKRAGLSPDSFTPSNSVYIRWYEFPIGFLLALFFSYNPATGGIGILSFFDVPGFV